MSSLSPIIVRRSGPPVRSTAFARPQSFSAYAPAAPAGPSDEAKLFASTFLGGLVFFATILA